MPLQVPELLIIAVLTLLLFGGRRIGATITSIGQAIRSLRPGPENKS